MAKVIKRSGEEVTVDVTVLLGGGLLEIEAAILEASNAVGRCDIEEALRLFDTDGSALCIGESKMIARGGDPKEYQTP